MRLFVTAAMSASLIALAVPAMAASPSAKGMANTCFLCHGKGGQDTLNGMSQREFIEEMTELKTEPGEGRLMAVIAKGFSDSEINAMAAYFAALKK